MINILMAIVRKKIPQINIIGHFSSEMSFSLALNSSFSDCLYFSSFKLFNASFSVLKTLNFDLLENLYRHYLSKQKKPQKLIKKMQIYRKEGIHGP